MKLTDISKKFGDKIVLDKISMEIPNGKCTAVMGKSGIGKTTLLRIISGLEVPDSGSVEDMPQGRRSFIFQENRLLENKSVLENILCVVPDEKRAIYYLERTGLAAERNKKTATLSGGMKRRLSLARALAYGGDVFFLDEPLRELDENTENDMLALLKEELAGKTVVLVVHDEKQADALADNVINI